MFITYAQNREDVILNAYFKDVKKGFYIDIGANHPVKDSVTKYFYEKGWTGINVEPIEELYELLKEDRPKDTNINMGVSSDSKTLTLRRYINDGLSTFSPKLKEQYIKETNDKTSVYTDIEVGTTTLKDLFEKYVPKKVQVQFLKIDVEGLELDVIESNDWKTFRPEMVCIEANHTEGPEWKNILLNNKYHFVYDDGLNLYYLADESMAREKNFSYVDSIVLGPQIMPFHVNDVIEGLLSEVKDRDINLEIQAIHLKQLEKEKMKVEQIVIEQRRFKSTVKMFVKALDKLLVARIEDLRKPLSVKGYSGSTRILSDVAYDFNSRESLLRSMQRNDLTTFYARKPLKVKQHLILYNITKFSYKGARGLVKVPYAFLKKKVTKDDSN